MDFSNYDELAIKAIRAYAMKPGGLSDDDCDYLVDGDGKYLEPFQCDILMDVITPGNDGYVWDYEYKLMDQAGFSTSFMKTLKETGSGFALYNRIKGLAQELTVESNYERKIAILSELSDIGPNALETLPTIIGVMQSEAMRVDGCDTIMYDIRHFPFMHAMSMWNSIFATYPRVGVVGDPKCGYDGRFEDEMLPDDVVATHMLMAAAFAISSILGARAEDEFNSMHKTIPVAAPTCLE